VRRYRIRGTPEVNPSALAWIVPQGFALQPGSARIPLFSQPAWVEGDKDGNNAASPVDSAYPRWKHRLAQRNCRDGRAQRRQPSPRIRQCLHHSHADPGHQRFLPIHPEIPAGQHRRQRGTFYLIGTAWLAGRRGERTSLLDWSALIIGLAGAVAAIALGVYTLHNPSGVDKTTAPAGMSFFFGAILLLATAGDIRALARGGISGRQRITRHLWRMCYGLFIATGSFFLGQQQVFPAFLRRSTYLTLPALLPLPY
jgi:hypothetical protein